MGNSYIRRGEKVTVIRRADIEKVHDYARNNCCPRDFLLIRLPMKIGLRTGEICTLRIENINFTDRSFYVLDSKKKDLFPLPLDLLTLHMIKDLVGSRTEGYVFRHLRTWKNARCDKPLTRAQVWNIIHDTAEKAGVLKFNPRMLRCYFAAHWAYVEKKNLVALKQILRHSSLDFTSIYIAHLSFWEDVKKEYDSVKSGPLQEPEEKVKVSEAAQVQTSAPLSLEDSICKPCSNLTLCKFAPLPPCVTACKHKLVKVTGIAQYR